MYIQMVKMVTIDLLEFVAILMGVLFYYYKMVPFVNAALILGYVNGQTVFYALFALLLVILPSILLIRFKRYNKAKVLRYIFYAYAAVIIGGTVCDMISYDCFINYTFKEGDAIFVNLMWNMTSFKGVVMSAVVAGLYIILGKQIKRSRTKSFALYIMVFIMSHLPAYVHSFALTGAIPRSTFLQKSLYVIAIQLLILAAFSVAATSRSVWSKQIWE